MSNDKSREQRDREYLALQREIAEHRWHTLTDDERYDQLVARLHALGADMGGVSTEALTLLEQGWWGDMRYYRRELLSVLHEVTAMMERAETARLESEAEERLLEERQREMEHVL